MKAKSGLYGEPGGRLVEAHLKATLRNPVHSSELPPPMGARDNDIGISMVIDMS